ncbi:MAG: hypothetical protein FWE10_06415 [Rikenellaceae bacterium]|nr:hypothetical protein [Rikenellaceae bacterium]MCL2691808.1 hypothetical protein [Rikenellaceae bacterium]
MRAKKTTKACIDKDLGLPTVFVRLNGAGFGFTFLIDTSVRHNLIDPCFFEEWINSALIPAIENSECIIEHYPVFPPPHEKKGIKRIVCKDGIKRVCETVKLDFTIDERKYSELFAIDPSMCQYFNSRKSKQIAGILGNDFLKKYKWILDYSEKFKTIDSPEIRTT